MIESRAPGRVNLIGEHVDYAGGLVLPAALELAITVTGEVWDRPTVRIVSSGFAGVAEIDLRHPHVEQSGWARYVGAVVAELADQALELRGFSGVIESDLPVGSGLSSSAALEVALAGALAAAFGEPLEGMDLAMLAQRAEHRAVGVPCGIMDQAASVLCRADHALLLDCASLTHRDVPISPQLALLVVDSGVKRRLESAPYAERRNEVEAALAALPPGSAKDDPDLVLSLARTSGIDGVLLSRLRHVVTENRRVVDVVAALERPEGPDLPALGALFEQGHASLRDDFEVSIPELDLLVTLAREEGAYAARMTGGGFGGAIVALVPVEGASAIGERVAERFAGSSASLPTVITCSPGDGASVSS